MKKKFTSILAILLAVLCTNGVSAAEPPIGDTDCDGLLTASDAAVLLQRILNEGAEMPIEKTRSYMYIADADGDETLTAADAAAVMQKVLKPDTKLANDGKTHSQWLERKGADKLKLFEKEVEAAQKVYSASCTYAVDLYTKGQWQSGTKVTFPRLISAGLLEDDYTYYKYRIYTNDDPSTHFIDRVEWETKNSPYGDKGVFPRDGLSDELEIEYGWFNEQKSISPYEYYNAAQNYVLYLKARGEWSENTPVTAKDMIKSGYLRYFPTVDYRVIIENGAVKYVEWENGKTLRYPVEYSTQDGFIDYIDMFDQAAAVFSAAQTYATDMYTQCKWTGEKYIDINELVRLELLENYPAYPFVVESTEEKHTPAVKRVVWEIDGKMYRYPENYINQADADALSYAAKVFGVAQTYATDLYTAGKWSGKTVITTDILLEKRPFDNQSYAPYLDTAPDRQYIIVTTGEDLTPAIHHVEFMDNEGYTCVYPGTPAPYRGDAEYAASIVFSAAQTYATDLYTMNKWNKDTVITVDDLVAAGLLYARPVDKYTIYTADNGLPAIDYVSWTDKNGTERRYPDGAHIAISDKDGNIIRIF